MLDKCIVYRVGHPASETDKRKFLKQNRNEGTTDKLDVCCGERKCNKAVSGRQKEIIITESKLHTTLKSEATLFIRKHFALSFLF